MSYNTIFFPDLMNDFDACLYMDQQVYSMLTDV